MDYGVWALGVFFSGTLPAGNALALVEKLIDIVPKLFQHAVCREPTGSQPVIDYDDELGKSLEPNSKGEKGLRVSALTLKRGSPECRDSTRNLLSSEFRLASQSMPLW
jgi:hypothetical protein